MLDLDALEQVPEDLRLITVMQGRNMADFDFMPTFHALIAELRATRKVVDELQAVQNYLPLGALWDGLVTALHEYNSLINVKGSGG